MPYMDNIDLPELTMEIRIQGKRIWWKPWRRRPDKVYHFPNVTFRFVNDDIMEATAQ